MRGRSSLVRAIAIRVAAFAQTLFPQHRSDWAKALVNEVQHVSGDMDALRWAIGTLSTAFHERIRSMKSGTLHIPRWLLSIEMLVCFVPLTLLGMAVIGAAVKGAMPLPSAILYLSAVAAGPLGLVVAFRKISRQNATLGRGAMVALCVAAGWTLVGYVLQALNANGNIAESWREFIIIALLPAIGVVHLLLITNRSTDQAHLG
jgi:hypothetical protein